MAQPAGHVLDAFVDNVLPQAGEALKQDVKRARAQGSSEMLTVRVWQAGGTIAARAQGSGIALR